MLILMNASKAEMAAAHARYLRGVADTHVRLRSHLRDTGGPEADGTLGSLKDIGYWFMEHLNDKASSFPEGWLPAWWGDTPTADSSKDATCPLTRQQLNLIDEVHVYIAEVLLREVPGSEWVIYRGHKRDWRYGTTVLRLKGERHTFPLSLVYGVALHMVQGNTKVLWPDVFFDVVTREISATDAGRTTEPGKQTC